MEEGNKKRNLDFLYILIGGLILCFYAFYNKYPLVYSDTGTYIHSGFENIVPADRPIFYGLFIRHISLHATLWLVVLAQGLMVSYVIFHCIQFISCKKNKVLVFFFSILFLTLFTGISVNVSQIIPDIFTPISFLCLIILLYGKQKKTTIVCISIIYIVSLLVHYSNLLVHVVLLIVIGLMMVYRKYRKRKVQIFNKPKAILVGLLILVTIIIAPTLNYSFEGKFRFSKGTHVFIMNHLLETGILEDYLNKNCDNKKFAICKYKDSLGWNFMWDEKSPLYKTGGWEANTGEYNTIIKDILLNPKYFLIFFEKSIEYTFIQLFHFNMGDTPVLKEDSPPYEQIEWRYNNSLREYISSKQFQNELSFSTQNMFQRIIVFTSLFIIFFLLYTKKLTLLHKNMLLMIILFFIINAFVCSTFSGICDRYQSRIIWILPFIIIMFINEYYSLNNLRKIQIL